MNKSDTIEHSLSGILLVDKPTGLSSQQVLTKIKRGCGISKIGHAGTLDPFASGLLIVLLGRATRLQDFLLQRSKAYEGLIRLGTTTDTDDITGRVLNEKPVLSDIAQRCAELERVFSGELEQVPPAYSAIHVGGRRAYELARKGERVQERLSPRRVLIHQLRLSPENGALRYFVHCSKGTYVRALARDIGDYLGCGACAETLRRVASGEFRVDDAVPLDELLNDQTLAQRRLISPEKALREAMSSVVFSEEQARLLRLGQQQPLMELPNAGEGCHMALLSEGGRYWA